MRFYLNPDLLPHFLNTKPLFDQVMALKGEIFRNENGRRTSRITLGNKNYFIKIHTGVGWKEIFKNFFLGRLPVLGAKTECLAIEKLKTLKISAPRILGYGWRGLNPAKQTSFILMEELTPTVSLETLCGKWTIEKNSFTFKQKLIKEVATIARQLHENGINHRDFYACHFLLDLASNVIKLYLIDLHRAQIRNKIPFRWRLKDLSGLYFSSKNFNLTNRDLFRFVKTYRDQSLKTILHSEKQFWEKVKNKGEAMW